MDLITLLLISSLLFATLLLLSSGYSYNARMVNKIPGPLALPLIGNVYVVFFKKIHGE
jgi:hypothetical protein